MTQLFSDASNPAPTLGRAFLVSATAHPLLRGERVAGALGSRCIATRKDQTSAALLWLVQQFEDVSLITSSVEPSAT